MTDAKGLSHLIPHIALTTAMVIWSTSFIAIKLAINGGYTPAQLMTLRMLTAVILFAPIVKPLYLALKRNGQWLTLGLMLICEPCLYFLFETQALRFTSASQAGMVSAILPVTVAVTALLILKERTPRLAWIGFVIATGGVIWLTAAAGSTETAPNPIIGNLLEAIAMICGALYTVCLKKLSAVYHPIHLTAFQAVTGFLFFVPQTLFDGGTPAQFAASGWTPFLMAIYLGSLVTFLGYGLYNFGVSRVTAAQAGAYINLMPVLTLCFGVWILNDTFLPSQYAASILVVLGIALSQRVSPSKRKTSSRA